MTKISKKYNIIFIGTPEYSVPTLEALINDERFNVACVITAPDAKVGRKQILTPPPVKVCAQKHNIKILQPTTLTDRDVAVQRLYEELQKINPDTIITIAYGQILPPEILNLPKHGCLNLHASLLPKYRGASPIQTAIKNGDTETGVTLMKMNEGLDTGPILAQEKIDINKNETGESLHDKLANLSAEVIIKYLADYLENKIKPQPQDDAQANIAKKLTREDGRIDWTRPAIEIENMIRAYYPWPGAFTKWQEKNLKIIEVDSDVISANNHKPGEFFKYQNSLAVRCGDGALKIKKLQLEGKKIMTAEEFLKGHKI